MCILLGSTSQSLLCHAKIVGRPYMSVSSETLILMSYNKNKDKNKNFVLVLSKAFYNTIINGY